jgi:hypothetical protein
MNADRRGWGLMGIGAMLLILTVVGLWRQRSTPTAFTILALVQGVYPRRSR